MYVLFLILALVLATSGLQAGQEPTEVEKHIRQVIEQLPSESLLRTQLLDGARGNGVRFSWMDELRKRRIKRVLVGVDITFDRHGHPKQMRLGRTEYFKQYDFGGAPSSDTELLNAIRASGLEQQLDALAMQKAAHAHWLDVPSPRPNPFVGGAQIEFLDDEWLPVLPTLYTLFRPGK